MGKELIDGNLKLTIIGNNMEMNGELFTSNDVRVDGKFIGNMHTTGKVVVSKNGIIAGNVQGVNIVIIGKAEGDFIAENNFQITPEGSFKGSVKTRYLQISDQAFFDGTCNISPTHENIKFEYPKNMIDVEATEKMMTQQSSQTFQNIQNKIEKKDAKVVKDEPAISHETELPPPIVIEEKVEPEVNTTKIEEEPSTLSKSLLSSKISQIKPL